MQKTLCAYIAGAAFAAAGCHAYQPYGYGYPGAYQMPSYTDGGGYAVVQPQGLQPAPVWNGGAANSNADLGLPQTGTAGLPTTGTAGLPRGNRDLGLPTTANTPPDDLESKSANSTPPRPPRPLGATVPDPSEVQGSPESLTGEDADSVPRPPASQTSLEGDGAEPNTPYDPLNNGDNETIEPIEKMGGEVEFPGPKRLGALEEDQAPPVARAPAGGPNPYKFDAENYSWLRGVAEQDEENGLWRVRYCLDENVDHYNGILTLADDGDLLAALLPGDVILVKGKLDHAHRDPQNRSTFRVSTVSKLKPRGDGPR